MTVVKYVLNIVFTVCILNICMYSGISRVRARNGFTTLYHGGHGLSVLTGHVCQGTNTPTCSPTSQRKSGLSMQHRSITHQELLNLFFVFYKKKGISKTENTSQNQHRGKEIFHIVQSVLKIEIHPLRLFGTLIIYSMYI